MTQEIRLTREATMKRLEVVISGCETGELEHDQGAFHCGTAHCIGGWLLVLDKQQCEGMSLPEHRPAELEDWVLENIIDLDDGLSMEDAEITERYLEARYTLTHLEELSLFAYYLSLERIRENFELMKKSDREVPNPEKGGTDYMANDEKLDKERTRMEEYLAKAWKEWFRKGYHAHLFPHPDRAFEAGWYAHRDSIEKEKTK